VSRKVEYNHWCDGRDVQNCLQRNVSKRQRQLTRQKQRGHDMHRLPRQFIIAILLFCSSVAAAQDRGKTVPFRNRSVDLIILKNGLRLLGTVLPGDDTQIFVRRQWIETTAADFVKTEIEPQLSLKHEALASPIALAVEAEIVRLQNLDPVDLQYIGLLRETRDRLQPTDRARSPFLILQIPTSRVRRIQTQRVNARSIGFLGILNQVDSVESRSWQEVSRSLAAIPEAQRVTQLPVAQAGNDVDEQLARVLAALDIRSGQTGAFIQMGSSFLPEDDGPGPEAILQLLLSGSLQQQLQQLLTGEFSQAGASQKSPLAMPELSDLPDSVKQLAQKNDWQTIGVSSFGIDLGASTAKVRTSRFTRRGDGKWTLAFQTTSVVATTEVTDDQTQQIMDDPRIQQISSLFSGLGSSQADLSKALRLGGTIRKAISRSEALLQTQIDNVLNGRTADQTMPVPPRIMLKNAAP
jgi:hypothetical protein